MGLNQNRERMHYGWVVVGAGALTLFTCLGLGRFAYGMILPGMREALGLGYDQAGYVGTGNFFGYLISVAAAPWCIRRLGPRRTISAALAALSLCMVLMGRASSYQQVLALYFVTGMGSGLANVPVMVIIGKWFNRSYRGRATGLMTVGTGVAIVFTGFLIPWLNSRYGAEGWRVSWSVLGAIGLGVTLLAYLALRDDPAEMGLAPAGSAAAGTDKAPTAALAPAEEGKGDGSILVRLGVLYFAFGATYMIYATFIVSSLVDERGMAEATAGRFWAWVGFFSIFSGTLFGWLSDRLGRKWGLATVFGVQTIAYVGAALQWGEGVLILSVVLYGLCAWAIPTVMGAAVADYVGPVRAAWAFSLITFFFAAGQTLGPGVAGYAAEKSGTFASSFLIAGAITLVSSLYATRLKPPEQA